MKSCSQPKAVSIKHFEQLQCFLRSPRKVHRTRSVASKYYVTYICWVPEMKTSEAARGWWATNELPLVKRIHLSDCKEITGNLHMNQPNAAPSISVDNYTEDFPNRQPTKEREQTQGSTFGATDRRLMMCKVQSSTSLDHSTN